MTKSLLVVDDSPAIHKVIRIALSRHDFEVVPASSVAEANTELRHKQFALILIDSGISAELRTFEAIKAASKQVPILILMSGLDKLSEEDLRSIGINIFLKKPFEAKEILSTILKVLGIPHESAATVAPEPTPRVAVHLPPTPAPSQQLPPLPINQEPATRSAPPPVIPSQSVGEWSISQIGSDFRTPTENEGDGSHRIPAVFSDFESISANEDPAILASRLPLHEHSKKGKKAFGESDLLSSPTEPSFRPTATRESSDRREPKPTFRQEDTNPFAAESPTMPINIGMTNAEITQVIKNTVIDYCRTHFESLAREIITAELRRLAEEKSRHLLDG